MPLLALDRPTVTVVRVGPSDWPSGVRVVCAAQAATGVPPTSVEALVERTRARQRDALGVWHAVVIDPRTGREDVVGHALCLPMEVDHPAWSLIADPEHGEIPESLDGLHVLTSWLAWQASDPQVSSAAARLLSRMPPEFAVVLARDMLKGLPAFAREPGYRAFMKQHGQLIAR